MATMFKSDMPVRKRVKNRTVSKARAARRRITVAHEMIAKAEVRIRDNYTCRVPGCDDPTRHIEVAHLEDKGMGGDPKGLRSTPDKMLVLCREHHQGRRSVHSGHLVILPLDKTLGTNYSCYFHWRTP